MRITKSSCRGDSLTFHAHIRIMRTNGMVGSQTRLAPACVPVTEMSDSKGSFHYAPVTQSVLINLPTALLSKPVINLLSGNYNHLVAFNKTRDLLFWQYALETLMGYDTCRCCYQSFQRQRSAAIELFSLKISVCSYQFDKVINFEGSVLCITRGSLLFNFKADQ